VTPERWRRIEGLFEAAADLAPGERGALLDRECGDDPALRAEVDSLLASANDANKHILGAVGREVGLLAVEPTAHSRHVGRLVAGYRIDALVGTGGMGAVYRAFDDARRTQVAVKLIASDDGSRALREATLLAELAHPHVVRYLGHGEAWPGVLFLAMEWLDGEDLAKRLARAPLTARESTTLVRAAAWALGAAHARGIVHRDVKPSNLFLVDGDPARVKVLDFGIARGKRSVQTLTRTGMIMGTPGYMAPEQATVGARNLDGRADVFALGCVLFECLVGRPAFAGDDVIAVLARLLLEEPPRPSALVPGLPPALDDLVGRMLDKDPQARPTDGNAVVALLDELGQIGEALPGAAPARPALTDGELRLVSVVLAAPMPLVETAETLAPGQPTEATRAAAVAEQHGARLWPLADGTLVTALSAPARRRTRRPRARSSRSSCDACCPRRRSRWRWAEASWRRSPSEM
jgi:hypothetical protein